MKTFYNRKKIFAHREYQVQCSDKDFENYIYNSINIEEKKSEKKKLLYGQLKNDGIEFYYAYELGTLSPKAKGLIVYSMEKPSLLIVKVIYELTFWNLYSPFVFSIGMGIFVFLIKNEFVNFIIGFLVSFVVQYLFYFEYKIDRRMLANEFESIMRKSEFEYSVEQIYQNRFL